MTHAHKEQHYFVHKTHGVNDSTLDFYFYDDHHRIVMYVREEC